MTEKIVVSDANVFIDLFSVGLLDSFFELPWEIHTTIPIVRELLDAELKASIETFEKSGKLSVHDVLQDSIEAMVPTNFKRVSARVSLADCSALYVSYSLGYILLTGDRILRRRAEAADIEVHGILYVIKSMVDVGIVSSEKAIEFLESLSKKNRRLPEQEIKSLVAELSVPSAESLQKQKTKEFLDEFSGMWAGEEYDDIERIICSRRSKPIPEL